MFVFGWFPRVHTNCKIVHKYSFSQHAFFAVRQSASCRCGHIIAEYQTPHRPLFDEWMGKVKRVLQILFDWLFDVTIVFDEPSGLLVTSWQQWKDSKEKTVKLRAKQFVIMSTLSVIYIDWSWNFAVHISCTFLSVCAVRQLTHQSVSVPALVYWQFFNRELR